MSHFCFGNDPAKIERYLAFWRRTDVRRPLVGFTFVGWFPFQEFRPCRAWQSADYLEPWMIDPEGFIDDVLAGAPGLEVEVDRRSAIVRAMETARAGDVVVIAGKGHEQGQQFRDRTIPFDDRQVAREALRSLGAAA